jgi:hypothetical protein
MATCDSEPEADVRVLLVNDFSRVKAMGSRVAAEDSAQIFEQTKELFANAGFACNVNLHLVGQANFVGGNGPPSLLSFSFPASHFPLTSTLLFP